jgi:Txe/YoeB family toxin of Txe-Axe toxin-antitoxin module
MNIAWTPRFKSQLDRYTGVNEMVISRTAELIRKAESNPTAWHRYEEKLKDDSFGSVQAYKTAVTSGDRLVFVIEQDQLILVDIGKHEVMDDYARMSKNARNKDISSSHEVDSWFANKLNAKLLEKTSARNKSNLGKQKIDISGIMSEEIQGEDFRYTFDEELNEKWVLFLDEQQTSIANQIYGDLELPEDKIKIHFILGGPGTGKTIVLLNIAIRLENARKAVSFQLSQGVLKYLNSGSIKVPGANLGPGPGVVLLVDDPADLQSMNGIIRQAKSSKCKAVVIALDPLQWHEKEMPEIFEKIWSSNENKTHKLDVCYRQSAGVAKKQLKLFTSLLGKNSRFLVEEKQKQERVNLAPYLNLSLDMTFVDEAGRYKIYLLDTQSNFIKEIERFRKREFIWKHTHPIAFIYHDNLSKEVKDYAKHYSQGLNRIEFNYSDYQKTRGVEYQELFLFLDSDFWEKINDGQQGLKTTDWQQIACLHTLFSRPKDGLVIFII